MIQIFKTKLGVVLAVGVMAALVFSGVAGARPSGVTVPGAPGGLSYVSGNKSTTLNWTAPASAGSSAIDGYEVEVSPACSLCTGVTAAGSARTTLISGLTNYTQYKFRVRAHNASGWGAYSYQSGGNTPGDARIYSAGWGLRYPLASATATVGGNLYITNYGSDSVTKASLDGRTVSTITTSSAQFNGPSGIASDGANLWITNTDGNSVTELDSAGAVIRVVSGTPTGLNGPTAITVSNGTVYVVNSDGDSVTMLDATDGSVVGVVTGNGLRAPIAIAADSITGNVWVVNYFGGRRAHFSQSGLGSITILNADGSRNSVVQDSSLGSSAFNYPTSISIDGNNAWVAQDNEGNGGGSVLKLTLAGGLVSKITDASFSDPQGISSNGSLVLVSNFGGNSVSTLTASTGVVGTVLSGSRYGFNGPTGVFYDGSAFWVTNSLGNSITKYLP